MILPKRDKYIIFGAGQAGKQLAAKFPLNLFCFIDNNADNIGNLNGIPVKKPADAASDKDNSFIILATWKYADEFSAQLDELGFVRGVDYGDFRDYDLNFPTITKLRVNATYRCNSRCQMCKIWENKQGADLPIDDWRKIANDPFFKNVEDLYITGGETSLLPDFPEYIREAVEAFPKLRSVSNVYNGLLPSKIVEINKRIKKICDDNTLSLFVSISIDGNEEENDTQRGIAGGFKKALATIEKLNEIGITPVVSCTLTKINIFGVEKFLAFLNSKGLRGYFKLALQARFFNNDSSAELLNYNDDELFQIKLFFRKLIDFYKDEPFAYATAMNTFYQLCGERRLLSCAFRDRNAASVTETGKLKYCCSRSDEMDSLLENPAALVYQNNLDYLDFLRYTICDDCNADAFGGESPEMREVKERAHYWDNFYAGRHWEKFYVDLTLIGDVYGYEASESILLTGVFGEESVWDIAVAGGLAREWQKDCGRLIVASTEPFLTEYLLENADVDAEVISVKDEKYQYACQFSRKIVVYDPLNKHYTHADCARHFADKTGKAFEKIDNGYQWGKEFINDADDARNVSGGIACFLDTDGISATFALSKIISENPGAKVTLYSIRNTPFSDNRDIYYKITETLNLNGVDVYAEPMTIAKVTKIMRGADKLYVVGKSTEMTARALDVEFRDGI